MKNNWWVLFPLKGLELTDLEHDLADPLWSDSTIISKVHADTIIRSMKLNQAGAHVRDHERDAIYMMDNVTFKEKIHSFIAIKRSGPRLTDVPEELHCDMYEQTSGDPEKRASQIAALIELAVLVTREDWMTCALVDQIHRRTKSVIKLSIQDSEFGVEMAGPTAARSICNATDNEKLSRNDLKVRVCSDPIAPLASVLSSQDCSLGSSLYKAISESAIRLSDALHVTTRADQLLGSVTAIEIMLTDQPERFELIKNRIETLIGAPAYEHFKTEMVLKARNSYVHQGINLDDRALVLKSTGLSLCCLLTYAEAAARFNSKSSFLSYLDFIRLGQKTASDWTDSDRTAFTTFLKHKPGHYQFPFFKSAQSSEKKKPSEGSKTNKAEP
ncbi:MAG: hypothetical protein ABI865_11625 [Nitrosospira sp.]